MQAKPSTYDFDSFIRVLRQTQSGCLAESYVRVEHGESFLRSAQEAFRDIGEYFDEEYFSEDHMVNQFLLMLEDEVGLKAAGLPTCI